MVQWWLSTTSCCRKPDGSTGSNWWKRWGRWLWGEMLWKQRSQRDLMRGFHASQILISSIVCVCVDNMLYALICTPSVQHMTSSYFNARWRMPKRNPSPSRPVETCWNCRGNSLLRKLPPCIIYCGGSFCWSIVIPKWITLEFMRKLRVSYFSWWQAQFDQDDAASNVATISNKVWSWSWLKYLRWVGTSAQFLPFPSILFHKKKPCRELACSRCPFSGFDFKEQDWEFHTDIPRTGMAGHAMHWPCSPSIHQSFGQFLNKTPDLRFVDACGPGVCLLHLFARRGWRSIGSRRFKQNRKKKGKSSARLKGNSI